MRINRWVFLHYNAHQSLMFYFSLYLFFFRKMQFVRQLKNYENTVISITTIEENGFQW